MAVHRHELALQKARVAQQDPAWQGLYRATRPKVEPKISHLTRRPWGPRKGRCPGPERNLTDLLTRAGVVNLANLARKGLRLGPTGWAVAKQAGCRCPDVGPALHWRPTNVPQ